MNRVASIAARTVATVIVAGAVVLAAPVPAQAGAPSTVDVVGTHLYFTASAGVHNHVVILYFPAPVDMLQVTDFSSTPITFTHPSCSHFESDANVRCAVPGLTMLHVSTLDGIDTVLNYTDRALTVDTGTGDDGIDIGGRPGTTSIVNGGAGDDEIGSGRGDDRIDGGTGIDTVSYAGSDAVTVSLIAGVARRATDVDSLTGIENVKGSSGADTITGNDVANVLDGGYKTTCYPDLGCLIVSGDDRIYGLGGSDFLYGRGDDDRMYGGMGTDTLYGGDGDDLLSGEGGFDMVYGEAGTDTCSGELNACEHLAS
jgi:Ca2+-binding RTX toxin-like protein